MFSTEFESFGFSVQKKKRKVDGSILDFRSEHFFLSIFDLQVTPKLPTPVRVNWPFSSEDAKNRIFTRWPPCHLGFPIGTILPNFNLPVTPMLPAKFRVNLPLLQEKKRKTDFLDGQHGGHLGCPIGQF